MPSKVAGEALAVLDTLSSLMSVLALLVTLLLFKFIIVFWLIYVGYPIGLYVALTCVLVSLVYPSGLDGDIVFDYGTVIIICFFLFSTTSLLCC